MYNINASSTRKIYVLVRICVQELGGGSGWSVVRNKISIGYTLLSHMPGVVYKIQLDKQDRSPNQNQ